LAEFPERLARTVFTTRPSQQDGEIPVHSPRILIAGVGNELLTDDGVGVHAIRELEHDLPMGVEAVAIGTDVLRGLPFLESAERVLLIDAAHGGQPPGTIYVFDATDAVATGTMHSLHSMGLREALKRLAPNCVAPPITVMGVEPASLDYGLSLSPLVQAALPQVVALARKTVLTWLCAAALAADAPAQSELIPA
jgi:hydrogenase maturation protease